MTEQTCSCGRAVHDGATLDGMGVHLTCTMGELV